MPADRTAESRANAPRREASPAAPSTARPATRFLVAALLVGAAKLLATALSGVPVLSLLAVTSVAFFAAGALFGWAGAAAAVVVQIGYTLRHFGLAAPGWVGLLPYAATGTLGWLVFRRVPGVGRGFPNFTTLRWFSLAAGFAGLLTSSFISLVSGHWLDAVGVWARTAVVSLWLFAPPILILASALAHRWLAPIPGEVQRPLPRRVALVSELEAVPRLETLSLRSRPVDPVRVALECLLAIAIVLAGTIAIGWDTALLWWNLLYLGPVWWGANRFRLRGGLVAAAAASVAALASHAWLLRGAELPAGVPVGIYGLVLLFWLFGALLGLAAEREADLVDGLVEVNARLRRDLQRVVRALSGALEAKDAYTEGHLQRVTGYAMEVGRRLGLDGRQLELLQIASTLHDVGKIGTPEPILNKPGPLDDEEWAAMRRHPEIGARLLSSLDGLQEAAPLVLHHQERWDGRTDGHFPGYPTGLAGEEIPLGARIIAVVDCFDAMTTDRPYRCALSDEQARDVLRAERGEQFDPRVVDLFLAILDEAPWREPD
ncbi:MAG TPA: HD-GYP domain-containing protein [Thermoanaerobaculia bacterium]